LQSAKAPLTVVVAPLDWGLGHATRCIPIIRVLEEMGCRVVIVTSGRPLMLLQKEFPHAIFHELPAYNIYYQKWGSFIIKLTFQLRKILGGIMREKKATAAIIEQYDPVMLISDNRYGVRSKRVHTVFITHQMIIKIPGAALIEWVVWQWLNFQHRRFHSIWIPDAEGTPNLSGELSHKYPTLPNARFIGLLNRFEVPEPLPEVSNDILCILSGPEPQRSIFEQKILQQAAATGRKFILVQGISEDKSDQWISDHIRLVAHADARQLMDFILQSKVVISRGGYTTLMDLAGLGKQCIFVPTPGQTEQEYLVQELAQQKMCVYADQKSFDLKGALEELKTVRPFYLPISHNTFRNQLETELQKALQRKML
jgi:predicted glycosyltransferase